MTERVDRYKEIRQMIMADIERGVYAPGDTIPKQMEFARRYNVSRGTIRKAFDDLIRKGVLLTTKGKGTVVADHVTQVQDLYRPLSFSESKRVEKGALRSRVVSLETMAAPPWLARQLKTGVGTDVIYLKRVRILDGAAENYQCSYISKAMLKNLDLAAVDLENGSLFRYIEEYTGNYAMLKSEEIRAVHCPEEAARELGMEAGSPVLLIMRTVFNQDGDPLEYCEDYECTDLKGLVIITKGSREKQIVMEGREKEDEVE